MEPTLYTKRPASSDELPLFAGVRTSDPQTAHDAADAIAHKLSSLQQQVLTAFATFGDRGATGREAEGLPCFSACAPSTIRKRITELHRLGRLTEAGERDGLTVYRYVPLGGR